MHGHWLLLARSGWFALVVLILSVYLASFPEYVVQLQTVCRLAVCSYGQLSPDTVVTLQYFGLTVGSYTTFMFVLATLVALAFFGTGGVIFWRKSDDWMALLMALGLVLGGTIPVLITVGTSHSAWRLPILLVGELSFLVFFLVFTLFPDGRLVPRWTRWLLVAFSIESVVFGLSVSIVVSVGVLLPTLIFPRSLAPLVFTLVYLCTLFLYPSTIGVAILRYRLWDIDVLINRTLVYGALTLILTAVYVGLVIGLQALLRGIISQDSGIAIVISTLAIFNLVQPLRHRLQRSIDRRFYRSKYDAAKIIKAFSATLRQEVDLNTLSEQLVAVVEETMQPTFVSLWLRPTRHDGERSAWGAHALSPRHTEEPVHE